MSAWIRTTLLAVSLSMLSAGCASMGTGRTRTSKASHAEPEVAGRSSPSGSACSRRIDETIRLYCVDRPPVLPTNFFERASAAHDQYRERCSLDMHTSYALRELERCIQSLENEPNQDLGAVPNRREEGMPKVADLKADVRYEKASRRLSRSLTEIEDAHEAYLEAERRGYSREIAFNAALWEEAEKSYRESRAQIEEMMQEHVLDPRDGHAYELW